MGFPLPMGRQADRQPRSPKVRHSRGLDVPDFARVDVQELRRLDVQELARFDVWELLRLDAQRFTLVKHLFAI